MRNWLKCHLYFFIFLLLLYPKQFHTMAVKNYIFFMLSCILNFKKRNDCITIYLYFCYKYLRTQTVKFISREFYSHVWFLVRSWVKSARSWSWSWCPACWTERWTATCCQGRQRHLWILRSHWSLAWRRGPSTTGYRFPSGIAKPPVKTSSGKRSPPANNALRRPLALSSPARWPSPTRPLDTFPLLSRLHMNCSRTQLYIFISSSQTCGINGLHRHSVSV